MMNKRYLRKENSITYYKNAPFEYNWYSIEDLKNRCEVFADCSKVFDKDFLTELFELI